MWKETFKKLKNRTMDWFGSLGTQGIMIISSVVIAAVFVVILLIMFKKSPMYSAWFGNGRDDQVVSEETTADGEVPNSAAGEEDMPVVETATEGMKAESTPDTTILAKKEGAKDGYMNRCVFLGDSRTVAMVNYGFFNDDAALAQIGISHPVFASNKFINNAGKEYTLKSYLGSHQAPVIYILLGVNGINGYSETQYQNAFITLIDSVAKMAPNSNIVLVSIGPVDDNGIYRKSVQNAWIDKYNDFLLETAREKHIFYLDIAEILKGSDGQVKSEYDGGDGLHYSGKGCEAIFRYIVEHPVPGISDDGEYVVKYIKPDPNRMKVTMDDKSGIDEGNLKELMDMMMGNEENQTAAEASTESSDEAASEGSSMDEEAKKKAEEEKKKKAEEEEKKKAEEKKKVEEEAKEKAEKEAKEKAEKEAKEKAEKEAQEKAEEEAREKAEKEAQEKAEEEERRKAEEENQTSSDASTQSSTATEEKTEDESGESNTVGTATEASSGHSEAEAGNTP